MTDETEAPPTGGASFNMWFTVIRKVIVFLLGMAVMIDALWDRQYVVPELIIGMIMVGVLPIDEVVKSMTSRRRRGG